MSPRTKYLVQLLPFYSLGYRLWFVTRSMSSTVFEDLSANSVEDLFRVTRFSLIENPCRVVSLGMALGISHASTILTFGLSLIRSNALSPKKKKKKVNPGGAHKPSEVLYLIESAADMHGTYIRRDSSLSSLLLPLLETSSSYGEASSITLSIAAVRGSLGKRLWNRALSWRKPLPTQ